MISTPINLTSTDRVILRLRSEGWVDCPGLDFPALSQPPVCDLSKFVLTQLHDLGWLWQKELQLKSLIFSIPTHEFQVHPHLRQVLAQLEASGLIVLQRIGQPGQSKNKAETAIMLSSLYDDRFVQQIERALAAF